MGLPALWLSQFRVNYYNGVAVDIDGNNIDSRHRDGTPRKPGDFTGVAPDRDNPPIYESEPAYLKRLGLLTPEESKALTPADFEPVPLPADYWPVSIK